MNIERRFPNLYGWLVWGGGFRLLKAVLKGAAVAAVLVLGYWVTRNLGLL
jgi:hypothetical protein